MGYNREVNYINNGLDLSFNQFDPFGRFLNAGIGLNTNYSENFTTHRLNGITLNLNTYATFRSFDNIYFGSNAKVTEQLDYYEPRVPGRILIRPRGLTFFGGVNTDSRKRLSASINFYGGSTEMVTRTIGYNPYYGITVSPNIRFSDKFSLYLSSNYSYDMRDRGFVNFDEFGNIIFGVRYLTNFTNTIEARHLFRNNLSLSCRIRHYWARGDYKSFYTLSEEGRLIDNISYNGNHDFNFNAFNIDMVFQWQFAAGSFASLVWKNSIYNEGNEVINSYSENIHTTMEAKQLNTVSLKILYFFDYLYLRKKRAEK
jgi:hypothetical protein